MTKYLARLRTPVLLFALFGGPWASAPAAAEIPPLVPSPRDVPSRAGFYGRFGGGTAVQGLRLTRGGASSSLVSFGPHLSFALGVRFAWEYALHVDFDWDYGPVPILDGDGYPEASHSSYFLGLGLTRILPSGLLVSGGAGLALSTIASDDFGDSADALGFGLHLRLGYDWLLSPRNHVGFLVTTRYVDAVDLDDIRWRGLTVSMSLGFARY